MIRSPWLHGFHPEPQDTVAVGALSGDHFLPTGKRFKIAELCRFSSYEIGASISFSDCAVADLTMTRSFVSPYQDSAGSTRRRFNAGRPLGAVTRRAPIWRSVSTDAFLGAPTDGH
jgi:hypothetical protein